MRIDMEALETFFFRDARPFDKGEGWATGIFPPLPSTIYGALRGAAISQNCSLAEYKNTSLSCAIRPEMGSPGALGSFRLRSVLLFRKDGPLIPMPLDLTQRNFGLLPLQPNDDPGVVTDLDNVVLYQPRTSGGPDDEDEHPDVSWLDRWGIEDYLYGRAAQALTPDVEPVVEEPKTGIQRNRTSQAAEEHMLYVQCMIRLRQGHRLSVDAEDCSCLHDKGLLRLGHDGRIFSYRKDGSGGHFTWLLDSDFRQAFVSSLANNGGLFKLLFTTPALLAGGWRPAAWPHGLDIAIESAVVGRAMGIGGWDIVKKRPKTFLRAVPPGSVYYCRLKDGDTGALFDALFDGNLSDADREREKQGFGHTLLAMTGVS